MDVLELWKAFNDELQFFVENILRVFNFPHVKGANSPDAVAGVHNGWSFPLSLRKHDVD